MPNPAATSRSRAAPWLWAAGTVLLVAATGLATWHFSSAPRSASSGGDGAAGDAASTRPAPLAEGHDYYFHVKLIELADHLPGNKAWDRDGSGPDIRFSLTWRKNVIWKSIEKPDTLIGSWDLLKVDLRSVVTGGQTDLEGMVNAPLVHYGKGEVVELKVWDEDPIGSDDAGDIIVRLEDLHPGDNLLVPTGKGNIAIKRVVIAMIDRRTPLPDLVNMISNR